jgi:hypothetical protein
MYATTTGGPVLIGPVWCGFGLFSGCVDRTFKHYLLKWITLLKSHLGRKLEPDDHIFPHFSSNGIPDPARAMTHDMVQNIITRFVSAAGLTKAYTTHCFRRGGAQYRFMYAPIGKRWSLSKIRWWGGWAVGEHVCHCYATGY